MPGSFISYTCLYQQKCRHHCYKHSTHNPDYHRHIIVQKNTAPLTVRAGHHRTFFLRTAAAAFNGFFPVPGWTAFFFY
jgi:hypothetical protein